jgi:Inner membrane component of T3SS, cytoplasmic domain
MATRAIIYISEPQPRIFEVKQWPVTIGRALDNDLILIDEFVAPHHARIDHEDNAYQLTALQTTNGIALENGLLIKADQTQEWHEGLVANVGQVRLRLLSEALALAPEKLLPQAIAPASLVKATTPPPELAVSWKQGAQLMACLFLIMAGEGFITNNPDSFVMNTLKTAGTFIAGLLLWSLLWGLLSKVFSGAVKFAAHFFTTVKAVIATQIVVWVLHGTAFALSIEFLSQFDSILFIVAFGWLISRHLKIALGETQTTSKRTSKLIQYGIVSLVLGAIALQLGLRYSATGRVTEGLYMSTFMPPSWRMHKAKHPEVLEQGMAALKERTDKQLVKDGSADLDQDTEE